MTKPRRSHVMLLPTIPSLVSVGYDMIRSDLEAATETLPSPTDMTLTDTLDALRVLGKQDEQAARELSGLAPSVL